MRAVPRNGASTLSRRQREIAELLRSGKSSREIGALLCIDPRTVDAHVSAICTKLGVRTRVEIVDVLARSIAGAQTTDLERGTNLPPQVTSFVGRETEIAEITTLLGRHRLVTLIGSGGVGKTRTSLQVATSTSGSCDGVWFVELAPLSHGDYVPTKIAQAVGMKLGANGDPVDQLAAALKSKNVLLVIDNCEHLVDACARIISALINCCPLIRILASSRQALGIVGEATYRLPSLPIPPIPSCGDVRAASALEYAAVALFVARASAANNRFELTDANASSVTEICRRLDGIPLAIELAAAWVKILSPQQLCRRLDERFSLLTGGGRDRLARHRTLRALIDWSHELLTKGEQRLFRRLGVFANGFTLEAASAVGGGDELDAFEVFGQLAALVDKSLVMANPHGETTRYHLLESTRVYAAEKLVDAGEHDVLANRHLRYFCDRFVELRREYNELRPGIAAAFADELDDLRLALDGALARRERTDGATLLAAIDEFWSHSGLASEGIARCEAFLLELPRSELHLKGALGAVLANLMIVTGLFPQARETAIAAVGCARLSGDGPILAAALTQHAYALMATHDFEAAQRPLSEAEAIAGLSPRRRLLVLYTRAYLSKDTGDLDLAASTFGQLREKWRSAGFRRNDAVATIQLAEIEFRRRQCTRAADLIREAVALARNDYASVSDLPAFLVFLGQVLAVSGEIDEAVTLAIEAIGLWASRDPEHHLVLLAIELLVCIGAAQGDLERSARLAGYADARLAHAGYSRDYADRAVYERLMTSLTEHLAPDDLPRLTTAGAALSAEAAIALARTLGTNAHTVAT